MKKTAVTAARKHPDFSGVPGELVALEGLELSFSERAQRISPYDALLDQLAAAKGSALKFGDVRARASLKARAKKKGYRISFAEGGGALYVRFEGSADEDVKGSRRERILKAMETGPKGAIALSNALREAGDASVDAQLIGSILTQMVRAGDVVMQDGGTWAKNGRKRGENKT